MNRHASTTTSKPMQWDRTIVMALMAAFFLSLGIRSLLRLAQAFANNEEYANFVANSIPWVAVIFFVVGWLLAHGTEIAFLNMQVTITKLLLISFLLLAAIIVPWTFSTVVNHPVLQKLDIAPSFLMLSGYFFRYSMFHKRTIWLLLGIFQAEKRTKAEQQ